MADPMQVPEGVTPQEFFEALLPAGFAAQASAGSAPQDFTIQFRLSGEAGGE